jgi:uncharacterized membrane protein YbhN (UPF0104 family)
LSTTLIPFAGPSPDEAGPVAETGTPALPRLAFGSVRWHDAATVVVPIGIVLVALLLLALLTILSGGDNGNPATYQLALTGLGLARLWGALIAVVYTVCARWRRPALGMDRFGVHVHGAHHVFVPWNEVGTLAVVWQDDRAEGRPKLALTRRDGTTVAVPFASLSPSPTTSDELWAPRAPSRSPRFDLMTLDRPGNRWQLTLAAGAWFLRGTLADFADDEDVRQDAAAVLQRCHYSIAAPWRRDGVATWSMTLAPSAKPEDAV